MAAAPILAGLLCAIPVAAAGSSVRAGRPGADAWSPPIVLPGACGLVGGPAVAFPSSAPAQPTGSGAVAWAYEPRRCPGGPSQSRPALALAAVTTSGTATPSRAWPLPGSVVGGPVAVGASMGRVAVALATRAGEGSPPGVDVLEGRPGRTPDPPITAGPGATFALTRAYLGDAAVATVRDSAIAVRVQRYFRSSFGPTRLIPRPPGRVTSLTATMDYRSDVLVAWQQDGAIYAHMLRASERPDPTQRLGSSAPDPELQALVSDNDHGMVAWSSVREGAGSGSPPTTRVYIALSSAGVRFTPARRVASFADPLRAGGLPGTLALTRLSGENVVMAWTEMQRGHYLVRESPAIFAGVRSSTLLSDPAGQSVLAGLAAGPANEAIVVWQAPGGSRAASAADLTRLWAARTYVIRGDRVALAPPRVVADAGPQAMPAVAVDPASDRALVAWRTGAGSVEYASGPPASGYRFHAPVASAPGGSVHWLRITLGGIGLAALALAGMVTWRRQGRRSAASRRRASRR